jgi:hypothetical protein
MFTDPLLVTVARNTLSENLGCVSESSAISGTSKPEHFFHWIQYKLPWYVPRNFMTARYSFYIRFVTAHICVFSILSIFGFILMQQVNNSCNVTKYHWRHLEYRYTSLNPFHYGFYLNKFSSILYWNILSCTYKKLSHYTPWGCLGEEEV